MVALFHTRGWGKSTFVLMLHLEMAAKAQRVIVSRDGGESYTAEMPIIKPKVMPKKYGPPAKTRGGKIKKW